MKRVWGLKRLLSLTLSAALVFTNIGTSLDAAYAATADTAEFTIAGRDLVAGIEEMIRQGGNQVYPEDMDFTNGRIEKFEALFSADEEDLIWHEFFPETEGQGMDVDVRTFIRLPEDVSRGYSLTGEEEILFLYVNNGETSVSCTTTIGLSSGNDRHTKKITVKSFERAFGDEEVEYTSTDKTERIHLDKDGTEDGGKENDGNAGDSNSGETLKPDQTGSEGDIKDIEEEKETQQQADPEQEAPESPAETSADSSGEVQAPVYDGKDDKAPAEDGAGSSGEDKDGSESSRDTKAHRQDGEAADPEDGLPGEGLQAVRSLKDAPVVSSALTEPEESSREGDGEKNKPEDKEKDGSKGQGGEAGSLDTKNSGKNKTEAGGADSEGSGSQGIESGKGSGESADAESGKGNGESGSTGAESGKGGVESGSADTESGKGGMESGSADTESGKGGVESGSAGTESGKGSADAESGEGSVESGGSGTETGQGGEGGTEESTEVSAESSPSAESAPSASETVQTASPSQPEAVKKTERATDTDLVGLGGCSTAKAYVTTLKKLKALDDVDGYKVTYQINPGEGACIVEGVRDVAEGESLTFGLEVFAGYAVEKVQTGDITLEPDYTEEHILWYTVENVEEEQKIEISLAETSLYPPFHQVLHMKDGMDITISAREGILPAEVTATAEIVTSEKEELVKTEAAKEGLTVIAAPLYDINLWLDGEKLENDSWSGSGSVQVNFSGALMEKITRDAEQVQVMWVKDEDETEGSEPVVEPIRGTEVEMEKGESLTSLTWNAGHFTTYGPVATGGSNDAGKALSIEDLMNEGMPEVRFLDEKGQELKVKITDSKVTLENGDPLPRKLQFRYTVAYALANSGEQQVQEYDINKGDRFTYQYPQWLKVTTKSYDVTRGLTEVIGKAVIDNGSLTITLTKDMGRHFAGDADVFGTLDWDNVQENENEVVIKIGDVDYTLVFPPVETAKTYKATIKKSHSDEAYTADSGAGDILYDAETGLPSAVRFHVDIAADEKNYGPLTNFYIDDKMSTNYGGKLQFDTDRGVVITSDNKSGDADNKVAVARFGTAYKGGPNVYVNFFDGEGNKASLFPGQKISVAYWVKIDSKLWAEDSSISVGNGFTASTSIQFNNSVTLRNTEKAEPSNKDTFTKAFQWFTKNGQIVNELPGGTKQTAVKYQVLVNPDLVDMQGWTINDTLSGKQEYVGQVYVYGYSSQKDYADKKEPVFEGAFEFNSKTNWTYSPGSLSGDTGKLYYVFEYYATPQEAVGEDLHNRLELTAPGWSGSGSGAGIGGDNSVTIRYNTYTLKKENLSSKMDASDPEKVNGAIGWGGEFGEIQWKSTIEGYNKGSEEGAMIPSGSVYTDSLSVKEYGKSGALEGLLKYHTFDGEGGMKLVMESKSGPVPDSAYELEMGADNRSFTITFREELEAPVTLAYSSYVTDFLEMTFSTNLRFVNTAKFEFGDHVVREAKAAQPYIRYDYINKELTQSKGGVLTWKLNINGGGSNSGKTPIDLKDYPVEVWEKIPAGTELQEISLLKNNKEVTLTEGDEYSLERQGSQAVAVISLNKVAQNHGVSLSKMMRIIVRTRVTDLTAKEFTNKAQMVIDEKPLHEAIATKAYNNDFITKGMAYNANTAPLARYTVTVNPGGADISNLYGGTLTVEDYLGSTAMSYVPESFTVVRSDNGEPVTGWDIAVSSTYFRISGLPDETPLTITYNVAISGNVNAEVNTSNSATLIYGDGQRITASVSKKVVVLKPMATGTGDPYVIIDKVDQNGKALEGAEFTVYPVVKEAGNWEIDKNNPVGTFAPAKGVTGNGNRAQAEILGIEKGKIYYLEETVVPDTYSKAEGMYFVIAGDTDVDMPEGAHVAGVGYTFILENKKNTGNLQINKVVEGKSGLTKTFYFTVSGENGYYYNADGKGTPDQTVISVDYVSESQDNYVLAANLPVGTYEVREVADRNGTPVTQDNFYYTVKAGAGDTDRASVTIENGTTEHITFTNTYNALGGITFEGAKTIEGRSLRDGEFLFEVYEGNTLVAEGRNTAEGSIVFDEISYKETDLGQHTYTVSERQGNTAGITYDPTVYTVTVQVTDEGDRTIGAFITGIKGPDQTEGSEIRFHNIYTPDTPDRPDRPDTPNTPPGGGSGGGGSSSGGGRYQPPAGGPGITTDITPEPVPLAPLPDIPQITLLEDEVPLAPLPKTGDRTSHHYAIAALLTSLMTGLYLSIRRRKEE